MQDDGVLRRVKLSAKPVISEHEKSIECLTAELEDTETSIQFNKENLARVLDERLQADERNLDLQGTISQLRADVKRDAKQAALGDELVVSQACPGT